MLHHQPQLFQLGIIEVGQHLLHDLRYQFIFHVVSPFLDIPENDINGSSVGLSLAVGESWSYLNDYSCVESVSLAASLNSSI